MKEELQNKLIELINSGELFLKDQLPGVAAQFLNYYKIDLYGDMIFSGAIILLILIALSILFVNRKIWDEIGIFLGSIFASIGLIVALCCFTSNIVSLVQIYQTPKAYLMNSILHTRGCRK